jgi:hypothetical protein
MNPDLAFEIVELALFLAKSQATGKVQQDATAADTLLKIIQGAAQAYQAHTGEALDPSRIQAEEPI